MTWHKGGLGRKQAAQTQRLQLETLALEKWASCVSRMKVVVFSDIN